MTNFMCININVTINIIIIIAVAAPLCYAADHFN